jgi:hypothetical protein
MATELTNTIYNYTDTEFFRELPAYQNHTISTVERVRGWMPSWARDDVNLYIVSSMDDDFLARLMEARGCTELQLELIERAKSRLYWRQLYAMGLENLERVANGVLMCSHMYSPYLVSDARLIREYAESGYTRRDPRIHWLDVEGDAWWMHQDKVTTTTTTVTTTTTTTTTKRR